MARDVMSRKSPGSVMSVVAKPMSVDSSAPTDHTQHGSPSSSPLVWPSPS
jgi:hypothetical protein